MEKMPDQQFIEYIVKALVDNPDDVQTERTVDEMGVLIQLKINQADMGKVIGKEGRTAKALRTLLRVIGSQDNARINLKIVEPEGGRSMDIPNGEEASTPTEEVAEAPAEEAVEAPAEENVSSEVPEEKEGDEDSML